MSKDWYNEIAIRNGGYKSDAVYSLVGESGEEYFEELLISLLPDLDQVLDMGCGHGEFTIKMSKYCNSIIGADNSSELLKIAQRIKPKDADNLKFIYASTKEKLIFTDNQFDLVYVRRGPTSIVDNSRILKVGGKLVGIHTFDLPIKEFVERLKNNGFINIKVSTFDKAHYLYESKEEFSKHISSMHCSKDYTLEENEKELDLLVEKNMRNGKITWPQNRYVWQAEKNKKEEIK